MQIGIVGLGLMGGSAAKAIRKYTDHAVWGYDRDAGTMERALAEGAIRAPLGEENLGRCDLVLVALWPEASVEYVTERAARFGRDAVVVDFCGVKRGICRALGPVAKQNGFCFVGGHPMAGTERSGFECARGDLFRGASMILTPGPETTEEALERLSAFFLSLGFGSVCRTSPEEHDRMIAYTSQLAHVLSSAYVKAPSAGKHRGFSASSFQDMTRVARLNEDMWTELFLNNRDYLAEEVEGLSRRLAEYGEAIRAGEAGRLRGLLRDGRLRKENIERGE